MFKRKYTKKIPRRAEVAVIGVNFASLLTAWLLLQKRYQISLYDFSPNQITGGGYDLFAEVYQDQSYYYTLLHFFNYRSNSELYNIMQETLLNSTFKTYCPKNIISIFSGRGNEMITIRNSFDARVHEIKRLANQLPHFITNFLAIIQASYENLQYLNRFASQFTSAQTMMEFFFESHPQFNQYYEWLWMDFGIDLTQLDPKYFLSSLCQNFVGEQHFYANNTAGMSKWLLNAILQKNAFYFPNETLTQVNIKAKRWQNCQTTKRLIKAKKFVIGSALDSLATFIQPKTQHLVFDQLAKFEIKSPAYTYLVLCFKQNVLDCGLTESCYYFNEHNLSTIKLALASQAFDLHHVSLMVINQAHFVSPWHPKNFAVVVKWVDYLENWTKNDVNQNQVYEIIVQRLELLFKGIKKIIIGYKIISPLTVQNLNQSASGSLIGGVATAATNWQHRSTFLPFRNAVIASEFGAPGTCLNLQVKTALWAYHGVQVHAPSNQHSRFDTLNCYEVLKYIASTYQAHPRYEGLQIGFSFDYQYHFCLYLTKMQCVLEEVEYKVAMKAKIFIACDEGVLKNIIQARTYINVEVFKGRFRVRGGVWMFKRILRLCFPYLKLRWENYHGMFYHKFLKKQLLEEAKPAASTPK